MARLPIYQLADGSTRRLDRETATRLDATLVPTNKSAPPTKTGTGDGTDTGTDAKTGDAKAGTAANKARTPANK